MGNNNADERTAFPRAAFSVAEFCQRNGISLALFWRLREADRAPKLMYLGRAIRISAQAEREWQVARENPPAAEAALIARERALRSRHSAKAGKLAAAKKKQGGSSDEKRKQGGSSDEKRKPRRPGRGAGRQNKATLT